MRVVENHDPMVPLPTNENLFYKDGKAFMGRKEMIERLVEAAKNLSEQGYRLHIYQTYRSPEEQAKKRVQQYEELRKRHHNVAEEDILRMLNKAVARVGGGHQTGGAVDLCLCDKEGRDLDMGAAYREHTPKTATRCKSLSATQCQNRRILLEAMQQAGFVNYPAEWWHFSYGDKLWAAYSGHYSACYGII
jgi:D-alanyl-D-alanine dipeptidase